MDALTEEGLIFLGGPVGTGDGDYALLVFDAENEAEVRTRLGDDPWADGTLVAESIELWSVWLRSAPG